MIGRLRGQASPEAAAEVEQRGFDDFEMRLGDVMRGERATLGKSLLDVQRELKIRATYIAAIENADPSAFETPGFIAGYVRSYSRYLDIDPDWAFRAFCAESGFTTAHGLSAAASSKRTESAHADRRPRDPFGEGTLRLAPMPGSGLSQIEPRAIGSVAVLLGLIGLIGYGGFAVLTEIQKVQLVPVDETPQVVAELDPLEATEPAPPETDAGPVPASDRFDRLYRPEALDVPVLVARDAAISTLDPRRFGALAGAGAAPETAPRQTALADVTPDARDARTAEADPETTPVQVVADPPPELVMIATAASWVRVRAADGTVIYETTMQEGDRFVLPATEEPATLRTGQSGAIFFAVNGDPFGPVGATGAVTSGVALDAARVTERFAAADTDDDTPLARVVAELNGAAEIEVPPSD